jgi:hypothetical protein
MYRPLPVQASPGRCREIDSANQIGLRPTSLCENLKDLIEKSAWQFLCHKADHWQYLFNNLAKWDQQPVSNRGSAEL